MNTNVTLPGEGEPFRRMPDGSSPTFQQAFRCPLGTSEQTIPFQSRTR